MLIRTQNETYHLVRVPFILKEIESMINIDIVPIDFDVFVSVWSLVFVSNTQKVEQFVGNHVKVLKNTKTLLLQEKNGQH